MLAPFGDPARPRILLPLPKLAELLFLLFTLLQTTPGFTGTWALSNPQPAQVPAGSYVDISFDADNPPGPYQFQFDVFDQPSGQIKHVYTTMTCTGTTCSGKFSTTLWAMAAPNTTVTVYNYGPWVGWTSNPATTFQITDPTWGDITPNQFTRGAGWTPLSFESNLLGDVSLEYSYTANGETVTALPVGASCANGRCQLSIVIPENADTGPNGELWLLANPVLTNRQPFTIIRPPIVFNPPYLHPEIPWGPLMPTKWPRGSHTYPVVTTDVTSNLQVGVWILYATADAQGWTAQPTALSCQPASPYEQSVCAGGGWIPPANATTWGCVRKAQAGEDLANLDPAVVRAWMDDPSSCLPFQIVDYTLPYITSVTPSTVLVNSGDTTLTIEGEWGTTDNYRTYIGFGEMDQWGGLPWYAYPEDVISQTLTRMVVRVPGYLLTSVGPKTVQLYDVYDDMPTATVTVVETLANAGLTQSPPVQSGDTVIVAINWTQAVSDGVIDCGTVPVQQHFSAPASCVYGAPGSYTVTGTYNGGSSADPIQVVIPSLGLGGGTASTKVLGQVTDTFVTYAFPIPVDVSATFTQAAGIGIPDRLDLGASHITIAQDGEPPTSASITEQNGTTYGGHVHLDASGTYTLSISGQTLTEESVSASATITILGATLNLLSSPLAQNGNNVTMPVSWPVVDGVTPQSIDCGTTPSQAILGTSGECVYTKVGSYTIQGRFTDAFGTAGIHTAPIPVTVPAIAPGAGQLRAMPTNGQSPTHDLSGPVPVASYGSPTVYPVPFQLRLTFDAPAPGQVGIPDSLDAANSTIHLKPIAALADLTAPTSPDDTLLAAREDGEGASFQVGGSLTNFPPMPGDPTRWRQRFILEGITLTGISVSTEMYLDGPIGDGSTIQYTWTRINPIYPYAPTAYRYVVSGLRSPIIDEPMTQTWMGDNQTQLIQGDGYFDAVFRTAGSKTVTLAAGGPLSGTKHQVDQPEILLTPAGTIAFTITPPKYNRPPATYRFAPNYPPLLPGEKLVGSPTWFIDGVNRFTGTPFYYTFSTSGTFETVVSQSTTSRTLYGQTIITVNANQLPTGSIDCSASRIVKTTTPWSYVLSCKAVNPVDPDGRIVSLVWALPDFGVSKNGSTYWNYSFPTPQAVRVQLALTDDSGGVTTLESTVDLRTLR